MEDCIICNEQTKDNICDKCYKEAMKEKTEFIKHLSLDGFYKKEDKKPKLSIPKKIEEMLDVSFDFQPEYHEDISWVANNMDVLSDDFSYNEFYTWLDSGKNNYNIALAYLAGKALGVELVEVEG